MKRWIATLLCFVLASSLFAQEPQRDWPQWRGPTGTGTAAPDALPPTVWSPTKNVRWRVALPGRGHSTPMVWGEWVFVTAAVPSGPKLEPKASGRPGAHDNLPVDQAHEFVVIAIRRRDGKIVWEKVLHQTIPHEGGHYTASLASASPICDGKRVYAFFGSHGLYCLDLNGKLLWQKKLGSMHSKHGHGEGASPALHNDTLLVNWDHEEQSFIVALDAASGQQRWRREREEVTSWSTPIVVAHGGRDQAIVCGTERVRSYDLKTGEVVWQCGGLSANIVATPVSANGVVYVGSSYEKRAFMAIDLQGAVGDITGSKNVLWTKSRGTPYVPSPLLYGDALYFLTHYQNVLTRVVAKSGEDSPGAMRLGEVGNIYASPVAAAGHVYVTDQQGVTQVIADGEIPRTVAVNRLGESVNASLAIVGDSLLIRGDQHLYCIAESGKKNP